MLRRPLTVGTLRRRYVRFGRTGETGRTCRVGIATPPVTVREPVGGAALGRTRMEALPVARLQTSSGRAATVLLHSPPRRTQNTKATVAQIVASKKPGQTTR